jgi:polysaccharide export outer membrane protein
LRILLLIFGIFLLSGCSLLEEPRSQALQVRTTRPVHSPSPIPGEQEGTYIIGPGDRILIDVMGEEALGGQRLVDDSGAILMPFLGTVRISGLSPKEASARIAARLRNGFLRDPQVTVQVTTMRPFFILGEVARAGSYAYQPGMTIQNAVAIAGGFTARAERRRVVLTRRSVQGERSYRVPVTTPLYPGDIVSVDERWF